MCVHRFKPRWPRQKATVWIFQLCLWTIASTLCVTMSNAIVCPLEFIVSVYSQLLLLAWESIVMWSSTRCGKDHPSFCSHCRIKQKTKENRISSTLEETPWQDWVHGSGKLAMSAQTNCNNHHWQPTCALTTSALKNYIMWWRETVMLVVAMIDSFLCSLRRDVLLENSSCLFPKTFHCSKVLIIYCSPHTYMLSGDGLEYYNQLVHRQSRHVDIERTSVSKSWYSEIILGCRILPILVVCDSPQRSLHGCTVASYVGNVSFFPPCVDNPRQNHLVYFRWGLL